MLSQLDYVVISENSCTPSLAQQGVVVVASVVTGLLRRSRAETSGGHHDGAAGGCLEELGEHGQGRIVSLVRIQPDGSLPIAAPFCWHPRVASSVPPAWKEGAGGGGGAAGGAGGGGCL